MNLYELYESETANGFIWTKRLSRFSFIWNVLKRVRFYKSLYVAKIALDTGCWRWITCKKSGWLRLSQSNLAITNLSLQCTNTNLETLFFEDRALRIKWSVKPETDSACDCIFTTWSINFPTVETWWFLVSRTMSLNAIGKRVCRPNVRGI
jgi:hypothetical protein